MILDHFVIVRIYARQPIDIQLVATFKETVVFFGLVVAWEFYPKVPPLKFGG